MQRKPLQDASFAVFFLKLLWQSVSLNEHWTKIYFSRHMFLPGYLKSRVEQFYSGYIPGLLTTGDNERTSRWEILHRKITRPWKGKLLGLGGSPSFRALLAPRISRGHFFLANFFRVTHDGLSKRGTTRSLLHNRSLCWWNVIHVKELLCFPAVTLCSWLIRSCSVNSK